MENIMNKNSKTVQKYQTSVEDYLNKLRVPSDDIYTIFQRLKIIKGDSI